MECVPEKEIYLLAYKDQYLTHQISHPDWTNHQIRINTALDLRPRFLLDKKADMYENLGLSSYDVAQSAFTIKDDGSVWYTKYNRSLMEIHERQKKLTPDKYSPENHAISVLIQEHFKNGATEVITAYGDRDIVIMRYIPDTKSGTTTIINTRANPESQSTPEKTAAELFGHLGSIQLEGKIFIYSDKIIPKQKAAKLVKPFFQTTQIDNAGGNILPRGIQITIPNRPGLTANSEKQDVLFLEHPAEKPNPFQQDTLIWPSLESNSHHFLIFQDNQAKSEIALSGTHISQPPLNPIINLPQAIRQNDLAIKPISLPEITQVKNKNLIIPNPQNPANWETSQKSHGNNIVPTTQITIPVPENPMSQADESGSFTAAWEIRTSQSAPYENPLTQPDKYIIFEHPKPQHEVRNQHKAHSAQEIIDIKPPGYLQETTKTVVHILSAKPIQIKINLFDKPVHNIHRKPAGIIKSVDSISLQTEPVDFISEAIPLTDNSSDTEILSIFPGGVDIYDINSFQENNPQSQIIDIPDAVVTEKTQPDIPKSMETVYALTGLIVNSPQNNQSVPDYDKKEIEKNFRQIKFIWARPYKLTLSIIETLEIAANKGQPLHKLLHFLKKIVRKYLGEDKLIQIQHRKVHADCNIEDDETIIQELDYYIKLIGNESGLSHLYLTVN